MKEIPLTQGKTALVDDTDYEALAVHKWYARKSQNPDCDEVLWYAVRKRRSGAIVTRNEHGQFVSDRPAIKCEMIFMHREIVKAEQGVLVDHWDRDGLNNQRYNLRVCTRTQNHANSKRPRHNTSGYKGVSWNKGTQKWLAQIQINGCCKYLGHTDTPQEAHALYLQAASSHFGEFARAA